MIKIFSILQHLALSTFRKSASKGTLCVPGKSGLKNAFKKTQNL